MCELTAVAFIIVMNGILINIIVHHHHHFNVHFSKINQECEWLLPNSKVDNQSLVFNHHNAVVYPWECWNKFLDVGLGKGCWNLATSSAEVKFRFPYLLPCCHFQSRKVKFSKIAYTIFSQIFSPCLLQFVLDSRDFFKIKI